MTTQPITPKNLTKEDLLKIAQMLKVEAGIEIRVMSNQFCKKGVAIMVMNDEDMEAFKEIFKPIF